MSTRIISSSLLSSSDSSEETTSTTTRTSTSTSTRSRIDKNGTTIIREASASASTSTSKYFNYVICDDPNNHSPFVNPTKGNNNKTIGGDDDRSTARTRSSRSSSSLWQWQWKWPKRSTTPIWILNLLVWFDNIFVSWWLPFAFQLYDGLISLPMKRQIIFFAWKYYVTLHTSIVCNFMGFYQNSTTDSFYYMNNNNRSKSNTIESEAAEAGTTAMSDEYKALSTLLYPTQFFQVTIPRMRFSLSQLNSFSLHDIPSEKYTERITYEYKYKDNKKHVADDDDEDDDNDNDKSTTTCMLSSIPESQRDHCTVKGFYVRNHNHNKQQEDENEMATTTTTYNNSKGTETKTKKKKVVLFWIYGGAYLAGDAEGNLSLANEFLTDCNAHSIFIPQYRLAPEANIDDVLWDICLSYHYLLTKLQKEQEANENDEFEIIFVGISSGGAVALRLLQFIRDRSNSSSVSRDDKKEKSSLIPSSLSFLEPLIDDIITISSTTTTKKMNQKVAGAVLFGPYVDYRNPLPSSDQSFYQNAQYDWIVNEAVQHYGLPYLNGFIPPINEKNDYDKNNTNNNTNGRILYSPITHDMNDLPPLCLIVSEHETTYDMTIEVVNQVRRQAKQQQQQADVTIGIWKHMCHVFSMMQAFLPEGKSSIKFAKEWILTKTN